MRYLIIGLGIYGSNLALDLTNQGHEVIGADNRQANIDAIKDYISTVYLIDSTEESTLNVLPLKNVDLVIVAIGENFGASVKTVALLKQLGVQHIYARAIDKLHESILQGFEIDRILTPEQRAAADLTNEMELGSRIESMKIDADNYLLKFTAPKYFIGDNYDGLSLGNDLKLVAATRETEQTNVLGIKHKMPVMLDLSQKDLMVEENDTLTVLGTSKAFRDLYRHING